jgi:hypothetical protein
MQQPNKQDTTSLPIDPEPPADVTLLAVQREIGIARGTLEHYLSSLSIEPMCFHIGARSLSISREVLAQVPSPGIPPGSSERKTAGDDERKDVSDGL